MTVLGNGVIAIDPSRAALQSPVQRLAADGDVDTEKQETQRGDGGRTAVTLPPAKNAWGHQKLEEARKDPPPEASEAHGPAGALISDPRPQKGERAKSCCVKPRGGHLCQQPGKLTPPPAPGAREGGAESA